MNYKALKLSRSELQSAASLVLVGAAVLLFLPNAPVDPWGVFNPRKIGIIIVAIAAIEFLGYILTRILGGRRAAIPIGFLGGIVSSTAVILSLSRKPAAYKASNVGIIVAGSAIIASLAEVLVIVLIASTRLFFELLPSVGLGIVFLGGAIVYFARDKSVHDDKPASSKRVDWHSALRLGLLFIALLGVTALAKHWLGDRAAMAVSILGGFFELHGITFANAVMASQSLDSVAAARLNILLAATANSIARAVILWTGGTSRLTILTTGILVVLTALMWGVELVLLAYRVH